MTIASHVIQRARASFLVRPQDRLSFLDLLCTFATHYECLVHAYVLMANHVHVLLTSAGAGGGADLAGAVSERYRSQVTELYEHETAQRFENHEIRPIHAKRYLLACMRYIELNPVRAGIVDHAADYRWSSYRANALGYKDPIVTPHPLYYALGRSPEARRAAYARFVRRGFARPDIASP